MRYCRFFALFCLVFIASNKALAQEDYKDYTSLSFGIGQFINSPVSGNVNYAFFGRKDISQVSRFSPQLCLNIEYHFDRKWSFGIQVHYLTAQSDRDTKTTNSAFGASRFIEKVESKAFGVDFSIKHFYYENGPYSLYVVGSLGGYLASEKSTTASSGFETIGFSTWVLLSGGTGIRYFTSERLGFFGELGYQRLGPPHDFHFNCGVILKI